MNVWKREELMPGLVLNVPSVQDIERLDRLFPVFVHPLYKPRLIMNAAEEAQVIGGVNYPPLAFAMADRGFVADPFDVNRPTWQATIPLFPHGNGTEGAHQVSVLVMQVTFFTSRFKLYTGGPFTMDLFDISFANVEQAWISDARRAFTDLSRRLDAIIRAI